MENKRQYIEGLLKELPGGNWYCDSEGCIRHKLITEMCIHVWGDNGTVEFEPHFPYIQWLCIDEKSFPHLVLLMRPIPNSRDVVLLLECIITPYLELWITSKNAAAQYAEQHLEMEEVVKQLLCVVGTKEVHRTDAIDATDALRIALAIADDGDAL